MEDKIETVTISLIRFELMQKELRELREKVKEKTVIEYTLPPIYGQVTLVLIIAITMFMYINL